MGDLLVLGKPLSVGIYSAALKKEALSAEGYLQMIASTTRLNTPGPDLAALAGVHALTNVTGFGAEVVLPQGFSAVDQALLSDPQTSGGLRVSCAPSSLEQVMAVFAQHGFEQATVVGKVAAVNGDKPLLRVV